MGYIDDALAESIKAKVTTEIEEAFDYGIAQPSPTIEQVLDKNRMYSNSEGGML